MTNVVRPSVSPRLSLAVFTLVLALVLVGVYTAKPPNALTMEVGPVGGSYFENAQRYKEILARQGIDLRIVSKPNSMEIINDVADPGAGIDVGFIAQDVHDTRNVSLRTIGLIQMQPLFIFAKAQAGRRMSLDDLRGQRIVMPPSNSATSAAAVRVFELYDITKDNSSFTFMPLSDAARELRAGHFDAGAFMLAPDNAVIRGLAGDTGLRLLPIGQVRAVAHQTAVPASGAAAARHLQHRRRHPAGRHAAAGGAGGAGGA